MYYDLHYREEEDSKAKGLPSVIIPIDEINSGMYNDIDLYMYVTIVASMDRTGVSHISQEQLSKALKLSIATVNKRVNKLLKTEVNGKPLLQRELVRTGGYKKASRYTLPTFNYEIQETSPLVVEQVEVEELKYTPKAVINYWRDAYDKQFGTAYMPNYKKDAVTIKNKIIGDYDFDTVKKVIDCIMENYCLKWGNRQYPRPTLGQLTTWLFGAALTYLEQAKPVVEVKTDEELAKEDELARRYF